MKKTSFILLILFLLTSIVPVFGQENKTILTLEEVQGLVVKNSRAMLTMDLSLEQADRQERILKNDLNKLRYGTSVGIYDSIQANEQLKASLETMKKSAETETELQVIENQLSIVNKTIMDLSQQRMNISATQKQLKKAKEDAEDLNEDMERMQQDLEKQIKYQAASLFFNILQMEDTIKVLEKNYNQLLKLTEIERVKQELGMSKQTDVNKIAVKASGVNKQLKVMRESYKILKRMLNDLIGRELDSPLQLVRFNVPESIIPVPSYNLIISEVKENTHELYKMEREIEDLEEDLDETDGSHEEIIAEAEVEKAKLNRQGKEIEVENNVKNILATYEEKAKNYQLAQISYNTAEKEYLWNKKKYELGMISRIQFNQSEIDYLSTLNEKIKAGNEYYLAKMELEMAKQGVFTNSQNSTMP